MYVKITVFWIVTIYIQVESYQHAVGNTRVEFTLVGRPGEIKTWKPVSATSLGSDGFFSPPFLSFLIVPENVDSLSVILQQQFSAKCLESVSILWRPGGLHWGNSHLNSSSKPIALIYKILFNII
jgi:hypothetical protein